MLSLDDLLRARTRVLTEERDRERVIRIKLPFQRRAETAPPRDFLGCLTTALVVAAEPA